MQFESGVTYMMPVAFGPQAPHAAGEFSDVRTLMVVYRSTIEAIRRVLPEPLIPGPEPLVFSYLQRCRGVNFLAGGEYRLFGVNVAVSMDWVWKSVRQPRSESSTTPVRRGGAPGPWNSVM